VRKAPKFIKSIPTEWYLKSTPLNIVAI
jgi:hypothetical protein